ncbi:MAG TPA: acyl-CoA dehydrogenase [Candidatus Marinimicrobia bacterium]|nr:acyl-CoA dehydrogenase [Candidatus Neomarinimicrobiota bacterium]
MKDLLHFDELLSDDEKLIRQTASDFIRDELEPYIEIWFANGEFPQHLVKKMAELGFLGISLPEEFGGSAASPLMYGLIMEQLEYGDSGIRSFASVQNSLVNYPIWKYGSDKQKKYWLPRLAAGEVIGCFGLTEADFGSNPAGMRTRAQEYANHYILNGSKMWITNGSIADIAIVWAKLDGELRAFLVPTDTPGFSAREIKDKWSLRASVTSELVFEGCQIPKENILALAKGLKAPLSCLTQARFGIAWGALGAAKACLNAALNYAATRIQFDKPIGAFQLSQEKLVEIYSRLIQGELAAWRVAKLKEGALFDHNQVSFIKRNNVELARETAKSARSILGANGISAEYPIMRHLMNLESVYTYEGTHEIHTLILGKYLTGESAF